MILVWLVDVGQPDPEYNTARIFSDLSTIFLCRQELVFPYFASSFYFRS
jgi:hypothetical protein